MAGPDEDLSRAVRSLSSALFPLLFPLLHYSGIERFELPPSRQATLALLVNAATSTVLPDVLLAKAVMMTSPLVATLGLSMMIPLSAFADSMRGLARLSPQLFVGPLCIFVSYLLELWEEEPSEAEEGRSRRRAGSIIRRLPVHLRVVPPRAVGRGAVGGGGGAQ